MLILGSRLYLYKRESENKQTLFEILLRKISSKSSVDATPMLQVNMTDQVTRVFHHDNLAKMQAQFLLSISSSIHAHYTIIPENIVQIFIIFSSFLANEREDAKYFIYSLFSIFNNSVLFLLYSRSSLNHS